MLPSRFAPHSVVCVLASVVLAAATPSPDPERAFLDQTAALGLALVESGKLAAERGHAIEVRRLGENVATTWTALAGEIRALADARVVSPPTAVDLDHQNALDRLRGLSDVEFDAAFVAAVLPDHARAAALLRDATRSTDAEIAGFARRALVEVEGQRRTARALADKRAQAPAER